MKSEYMREQLRALPFAVGFIALGVAFMFFPHIALAVIAGALFLIALIIAAEDHLLVRRGFRAQGVVVDHHAEEDCFFPVVEFRDRKGTTRRESTKSGSGIKRPSVGSRVVVLYDPHGKMGCEIDSFFRRWGVAIAIGGLGCIFALGATLAK